MLRYIPKFYQTDLVFIDNGEKIKPRYELYDTFLERGIYKTNNLKLLQRQFMGYWRKLKKKEGAIIV